MRGLRFVSRFFRRARRDAELARDIEFYLDAETEDNIARGMQPEAAREQARRRFGNTTLVREEIYTMNRSRFFDTLCQDVQYSVRQLRRSPGFTAIAAVTLALGIGGNTAMFSIVNRVLLRPLPYKDPGRLTWIAERFALSFGPGAVLGPDYVAWVRQNQAFEQIEGFIGSQGQAISLSGAGEPAPVRMTNVTPGLFSMLGLQPVVGRLFTADEGTAGHENVAIISERLWHSRFGGSPAAIGRSVRLNNYAFTVIGVIPANVDYPPADVWTPVVLNSSLFLPQSRPMALISVIGRLRPGITLSQAQANLSLVAHAIDHNYPAPFIQSRDRRLELEPLQTLLVHGVRSLLMILLGTVAFVFLIACANVANLSFSRGAARFREFAVRGALGAGRVRLLRQLLTESLLLAALGSTLGWFCGIWSVRLLGGLIPPSLPADTRLDWHILSFTVGITVLAALVSGLAPAMVASRTEVGETLKAGGVRAGTGRGTHSLRNALVVAEIALSLILLIGAGLLARSFLHLTNVHLGFNPEHVLTAQVWRPMTNGFQTPSQVPFFDAVLRNLESLPGVTDAAAVSRAPFSTCDGFNGRIKLRGEEAEADLQSVCQTSISPAFFRTMQVPLLSGRSFTDRDSGDAPPVVIMNEGLAREAFGTRDPIGQQVGVYVPGGVSWRTVVGVVANAKNSTLEQQTWPEIFMPYSQSLLPLTATFILRTSGDPKEIAPSIRKAVQAVDSRQAVSLVQTLEEGIGASTAPQWFRMLLLGLFALLALVLAAIGVFGVMAYSVSQRTHEIGVRVALGARPRDILSLAVGQGIRVTAIGLSLGVVGAIALTRFLASFLYDVRPNDLMTFIAASLLLAATALFACYVPASRAAQVDPLLALRNE